MPLRIARRASKLRSIAMACLLAAIALVALAVQKRRTANAEVALWIGGDVHLGDRGIDLAPLGALVSGLGVVNLEGPAGEGAAASTSERLANAPELLSGLFAGGVRVVGIANNHAGDLGVEGPARTAEASRRAGLLPAGAPAGAALLSAAGLTIAITAHDLGTQAPPHLAEDLAAALAKSDVLVATFHVTGPATYLPRPELRDAVAIALRAGARVVAAHGTHAVGPVERRGDAVIAWGLGNLVFACDCTRDDEGAILRVTLSRHGAVRAAIVPVRAGLRGAPARPEPDAPLAFDLLEALGSSPLRREGDRAFF